MQSTISNDVKRYVWSKLTFLLISDEKWEPYMFEFICVTHKLSCNVSIKYGCMVMLMLMKQPQLLNPAFRFKTEQDLAVTVSSIFWSE